MKNNSSKTLTVFLFALAALCIFIVSTHIAVDRFSAWEGLFYSLLITVLSLLLYIYGKIAPFCYILGFILNGIASGFSVSPYYLTKDIPVDLAEMFLAVLPSVFILAVVSIVLKNAPNAKVSVFSVILLLYSAFITIVVCFWVSAERVFFSIGFFCLLIALFYIIVLSVTVYKENRFVLKDVTSGSFGAFAAVTVAVLVILSEGDILDGLDIVSGTKKEEDKRP